MIINDADPRGDNDHVKDSVITVAQQDGIELNFRHSSTSCAIFRTRPKGLLMWSLGRRHRVGDPWPQVLLECSGPVLHCICAVCCSRHASSEGAVPVGDRGRR